MVQVSRHRLWYCKARHLRTTKRNFPLLNHGLFPQANLGGKLVKERRRAERSHKPLLVMVLNAAHVSISEKVADSVNKTVNTCVRASDICGLLSESSLIGVILTEVESEDVDVTKRVVAKKVREKLSAILSDEVAARITIGFRIYSETGGAEPFDLTFFPELSSLSPRSIVGAFLKRSLDIVGSITGLILFSPFFAFLPIFIKLTSTGPVFFFQERVGRNGGKFTFIKFRTMYLRNDDVIHREYVKQLIKGQLNGYGGCQGIYKIQADPRITPLGKVLRKYSLDELPQFLNVLKGDMSLVGPRPPICYEVQHYSGWQRNRLMGKKPGITGLWQVVGRSSTSFDEMVRLDLRYLKGWTILLDLRILLKTPVAVLKGKGAY